MSEATQRIATAPTMAAPCDTQLLKQPTAHETAKQAQHQIHNESHTATFHQLASTEASQTSNDN